MFKNVKLVILFDILLNLSFKMTARIDFKSLGIYMKNNF